MNELLNRDCYIKVLQLLINKFKNVKDINDFEKN